MSRVDLHIHSTASDGNLNPGEIVARSSRRGLSVIALTDHDTVEGVAPAQEAASACPALRIIPGLELSSVSRGHEVHILGYLIDIRHEGLLLGLEKMRSFRNERARAMIEKLAGLGVHINWNTVKRIAGGGSLGRPHIARAMLEMGYVTSFEEAFTRYIAYEGPAYVQGPRISSVEAIELILRAGGVPVLAHPLSIDDWQTKIPELKDAGLSGIEIYYDGYTAMEMDGISKFAGKYGLIATGGSDFHGVNPVTETALGGTEVPIEVVGSLFRLAMRGVIH